MRAGHRSLFDPRGPGAAEAMAARPDLILHTTLRSRTFVVQTLAGAPDAASRDQVARLRREHGFPLPVPMTHRAAQLVTARWVPVPVPVPAPLPVSAAVAAHSARAASGARAAREGLRTAGYPLMPPTPLGPT
ncbi:hypothetical protein ABH940_001688 [Streptacidiphilus sp. BW17]